MALRNVALPEGLIGVANLPRQRERMYNLIRTDQGALSRPGIEMLTQGPGPLRGSFMYQGQYHAISGDRLVRIAFDTTVTDLGPIAGLGNTQIAVDHAAAVIVVVDGPTYELVNDTLQVVSGLPAAPIDVAVINGRFVYVPVDGGPPFYSEPGIPSDVRPENFFDAETLPDVNVGVINLRNDLYIFGTNSTELFRNPETAPPEAPFRRVLSGLLPFGYFGGKVQWSQQGLPTVAYLGRDQEGGIGAFTLGGRISTGPVDEILDTYTEEQLRRARGHRFAWKGEDLIVFFLDHDTLAYNGRWVEFGSGNDEEPWDVRGFTMAYDADVIVGDSTGRIGRLADVDYDWVNQHPAFERFFDTFYRTRPGLTFNLARLELDPPTYRGTNGSVALQLSRDGLVFSDPFWRPIPPTGKYTERMRFIYRGGLGVYRGFAGIRIRASQAVQFSTDALWVDDGA